VQEMARRVIPLKIKMPILFEIGIRAVLLLNLGGTTM
jgi:hypothetical protein